MFPTPVFLSLFAFLTNFASLQDLSKVAAVKEETLQSKDGKMLTIKIVSLFGADAQTPEDGVAEAPPQPPPKPQHVRATLVNKEGILSFFHNECWCVFQKTEPMNGEGCCSTSAAVFTDEHLFLSEEIFKVLWSTCSEEIHHIEKRNNCILNAKVKVAFVKGKGEGNQQRALSEFKALLQSLTGRAQATVIAPMRPNPEELKDAQTRNDKPDIPLLWSPVEQNRQGQSIEFPSHSGDVPPHQQKPDVVQMDISDPLFSDGITIEDSAWKLMTTSYTEQLLKVQCKFGVEFSDTLVDRGQVRVRVVDGRNAAVESHALRALYRLYKRIITVPRNTSLPSGATGFTSPQTYPGDPPKKVPKLFSQSGDDVAKKAPTVEAATGDDDCPICLEKIKDIKQLECKHAFCHNCLIQSVKSIGLCCPVCRHIFGDMVGNQPDGTMTIHIMPLPLPGFYKCGTIVINYSFPSGIQTVNVQNMEAVHF